MSRFRAPIAGILLTVLSTGIAYAQPAHAAQQGTQLLFHYGIVPAEVVLAHAPGHAEREMHEGGARRGKKHVVLALFDASSGLRVADAEVTLHLTLTGGASVTRRLEAMAIAGQAGYGGFVSMDAPGIYHLRFDVKRPGVPGTTGADFEHRVPGPERGR